MRTRPRPKPGPDQNPRAEPGLNRSLPFEKDNMDSALFPHSPPCDSPSFAVQSLVIKDWPTLLLAALILLKTRSRPTDQMLTLHTNFRSSCSGRLRIALNLKKIPCECVYVNLLKGEHRSESYKTLNPSQSVPALVIPSKDHESFSIGQSVAALEYLEEAYPETLKLLPPPSDPVARAAIRSLVQIIASDIQPLTNMRIVRRVGDSGADANTWARDFTAVGLAAYESAVTETAGKYSYGDKISIADCCLIPAVWGAQFYDVDMRPFSKVIGIYERLMVEPAVLKAHWRNQEDTPEELKN